MLNAAKRLSDAASALWRGVSTSDRGEARKRVAALRRRYPNVSPDELFKTLVYGKCVQVGAVGALSTAVGLVPGVRWLGGSFLGAVADEAMVTSLQSDLVAEIFALYDVDIAPEFERMLIASMAAGHAGTHFATGGIARQLASQAQRFLGGTLARAALPIAGIATAAAGHVAITYAIAARAKAVAKMRHAQFAEWPDLLREFTMIDERKIASWAAKATQAAVGQAASAAQAWMRQLGSLLPEFPRGTKTVPNRPAAKPARTPRRGAAKTSAEKPATAAKKAPAKKAKPTKKVAAKKSPATKRRTTAPGSPP